MNERYLCARCGRPLTPANHGAGCTQCLFETAVANRELELREESLRISSIPERLAFIRAASDDDPVLCERLLAWLQSEGEGPDEMASDSTVGIEAEGIGKEFKLIRRLGEGGFGAVFLAEQKTPVKRLVALKVIKPGMDTRHVIARFEVERQALAMMDHPNIAKIFNGSATSQGRPFFVMELVRGSKITEYCQEHRLSIAERLHLFILVCQAIQHAHQKGIIHRDIKPSNVLVTLQDGAPTPKVIDFGIAKATQQQTDITLITQGQQFLGTPAYISPEQALITSNDIDTRSDIYSLGVLLYELLAGKPPFDNQELLTAGIDEMRRIIREKQPVRPSQRQPHSRIPRDLDCIVMKCLEKDRGQRYETANGLAMDVQRFLAHEPIVARPSSSVYRVSKVVRRNPLVASLILLLVAAVTFGLVTAAVMNVGIARAKNATDLANRTLSKTVLFLESEKMEERAAEGSLAQPLAWLAQRLRIDPNDKAAASRLISMLSERSLALPVFAPLLHDGKVTSTRFSPDGTRIMTACEDGMVRFWDARDGHSLGAISNSVSIGRADYLAGGKRLLVSGHDGVARIYDTANNSILFTVPGVRPAERSCFEGGGGDWLLVEHTNKTISRWDLKTGAKFGPVITFPAEIVKSDYSDAGRCVAVLCDDDTVHLRDQVTGIPIIPPRKFVKRPEIRLTPDAGRLFLALDSLGYVAVWNFRDGKEVTTFATPATAQFAMMRFTPDGRRMMAWSWNKAMQLWDVEAMERIGEPVDCGINARFVVSNSGRLAVSIEQSGYSRLIGLDTGRVLLEPIQHDGQVHDARFSPDDTRLLTGSVDGTARLWDLRMHDFSRPALPKARSGSTAAFNHAGNRVVVSVGSSGAEVCDVETAKPLSPLLRHPTGEDDFGIREGWFSPDDSSLLTVGYKGLLRIWDARTFNLRLEIPVGRELNGAKFSPDGRFIVAADRTGGATVWNAGSGQRIADLSHNGNEVVNLSFHPRGGLFLTAAVDGFARCWTLPEGKLVFPPLRHRGIVWSASFSPDGERIVTTSDDKTAQLWEARTGRPLHKPLRHTKSVYFACFSPDGRFLATTSEDGAARVWNPQTGEPISPLIRHKGSIWLAAFTPDSGALATASFDRTARLWDPETGLPISEPLLHETAVGRLAISPDGGHLLAYGGQPRLWEIVRPPIPVPRWFCELIEALAGNRQTGDAQLIPTRPDAIEAVRHQLRNKEAHDFYSRWAQWFLVDRMQEPVPRFPPE